MSHSALHAVADGLSVGAESFEALGAEVAPSACVGKESDYVVAGAEGGDVGANLGHDASDFVARDEGWPDAASEGAIHYQEVVVAETAGLDLY